MAVGRNIPRFRLVILNWDAPRGNLANSGEVFGLLVIALGGTNSGEVFGLLVTASSGQKAEMLSTAYNEKGSLPHETIT